MYHDGNDRVEDKHQSQIHIFSSSNSLFVVNLIGIVLRPRGHDQPYSSWCGSTGQLSAGATLTQSCSGNMTVHYITMSCTGNMYMVLCVRVLTAKRHTCIWGFTLQFLDHGTEEPPPIFAECKRCCLCIEISLNTTGCIRFSFARLQTWNRNW